MNLYIEVQSGTPVNHPAFEDNLMQVFGVIPTHWERFVRVKCPTLSAYQILESTNPIYEKVDGVWTDVWLVREMTQEEKNAKQAEDIRKIKDAWENRPNYFNFTSWVFNENTLEFDPPIPKPSNGNYKWSGIDNNWKEAPARPVDDNQYKFDFLAWQWVQVVN